MKLKSFSHMNCSLAKTLDIIGERWTLLILRDSFFGPRRFQQLEASLGISKNILTNRLNRLVEEGILERRPVGSGERYEYALTPKGLDLQPVLLAMTHWGDAYMPHPAGERLVFVERATGEPIARMGVMSSDGRLLQPREVSAVAGPALSHSGVSGTTRGRPRKKG